MPDEKDDPIDHKSTAVKWIHTIQPGMSVHDGQLAVQIAQVHALLHLADVIEKGSAPGD
jgi:hypothetical protein